MSTASVMTLDGTIAWTALSCTLALFIYAQFSGRHIPLLAFSAVFRVIHFTIGLRLGEFRRMDVVWFIILIGVIYWIQGRKPPKNRRRSRALGRIVDMGGKLKVVPAS